MSSNPFHTRPARPFRTVLLATVLSLFCLPAQATSSMAKIEGNVSSDMRELLRSVIGEAEEPPRSLAQARRRAEKAAEQALGVMRSQGFYGATVKARVEETMAEGDGSSRKPPKPILLITPGPQFTFSDISITYAGGEPDIADAVRSAANIQSGGPALAAEIVAAEILARSYLKAHGYPETEVLPRKAVVDHDKKTVQVAFNFKAGDKTRFGVIEQTGSANIVKSWPNMISPFESGEVFNDVQLNKLTSRVIRTGVFETATAVLSDEKEPNPDGTVTRNVILNVEQGDINTITGEIGYSTTDGSGLEASYERRNFIGYAQTLTLSSTLKTNQIRFGADYTIPYFLREDRSVDLGGEIAREDTDAFTGERVGVNALITQKISERLKVGLGAGLEGSQFKQDGEDVRAYLFDGVGRATYDSRNSILDPVKGVRIEANAIPTYNFGESDGFFTTVQAGASTYGRITDSLVLAGRLEAGTIFGANQDTVPLNRRFYGGGGGSVRGYGYQSISPVDAAGDVVGGRSITEASAELRYHGESAFGGVIFVDAGSVVRDDLPTFEDVRYGAGVGVRYYTSFAPLRADIAIPLNRRDGDSRVQVYISIGQAF